MFENFKNTHYRIRRKGCNNPDKHALFNKIDVSFEFRDSKNPYLRNILFDIKKNLE